MDRGRSRTVSFSIHDSREVILPACLISVSGLGVPWAEVETAANVKTHGVWYHIPLDRCEPATLGGNYARDFVQLPDDASRTTHDASDKVFVCTAVILSDYEETKSQELDTR